MNRCPASLLSIDQSDIAHSGMAIAGLSSMAFRPNSKELKGRKEMKKLFLGSRIYCLGNKMPTRKLMFLFWRLGGKLGAFNCKANCKLTFPHTNRECEKY